MTIVFVFKDNTELRMKCTDFSVEKNGYGEIVNWEAKGITENKPIFMGIEDIKRIYRVISDEEV